MLRKHWTLVALAGLFVATLVMAGFWMGQQRAASASSPALPELAPQAIPNEQIAAGQYLWSYAAKFVCGYQSPFPAAGTTLVGEPVVKPGNYATEINIHNPQYREVKLYKKVLLLADARNPQQPLVVEPKSVGPIVTDTLTLNPDYATLDDCDRIYLWTAPTGGLPAFPPPLMIGYLVILSRTELDVDVVYTAVAPGATQTAPTPPTGISIDEERVTGKRVFVPANVVFP
jgi:hypothetical protein